MNVPSGKGPGYKGLRSAGLLLAIPTLLIVAPSFVMNPMLNSQPHYEPTRDFTPIAELVTSPLVIATQRESPVKSLQDLIDRARAHPGAVTFAGVGPNTAEHMVTEMLRVQSNVDWVFAPYNGSAPAVTAALGGHVTAVIANYADVAPHLAAGKLRALAVGTRERIEKLEDIPTLAELGYALVDSTIWFGIVAPAGTPATLVEKIGLDMLRAVHLPRVRERLVAQKLYPVLGPEPFDSFLAEQSTRYEILIRKTKLGN